MSYPYFTSFATTCRRFITVSLMSLAPLTNALESDRHQPIKIQADSALVNESKGIAVYTGDVIIEQGTLKVSADEIEIHTAGEKVIQIIASVSETSKNQAHFEQQKNARGDMVIANARRITYLVRENRLLLAGNASLQQAQNLFRGELLIYEPGISVILESGEQEGSRVNMTIVPENVSEKIPQEPVR